MEIKRITVNYENKLAARPLVYHTYYATHEKVFLDTMDQVFAVPFISLKHVGEYFLNNPCSVVVVGPEIENGIRTGQPKDYFLKSFEVEYETTKDEKE